MIRLHCLSPESESRSGPFFGESAFTLRRLSPGKGESVNGLGIAGGWRVSGEIRLVFANIYVDLLPGKWGLEANPKMPFSRDRRFVVD